MNELLKSLEGRNVCLTMFNEYGCVLRNLVCRVEEVERTLPYDICSIKVTHGGESCYLHLYTPAVAQLLEGKEVFESKYGIVRLA